MKKIWALVWVLLVLFTVTALADDTEYVWKDYKYRILADGTAEITGHEKTDSKYYNPFGKDRRIKDLKVPAKVNGIRVTSIGRASFSMCASLQKVTIPEGVTHIHELAFWSCRNIKTLKLPSTLTYIGDDAFLENEKLASVKFPKKLAHIGERAFHNCDSLKKVDIPDSVTFIGDEAFAFCKNLKEVSIGAGLEQVGYAAHNGQYGNPFQGWNKMTTFKLSKANPHLAVMDDCLVSLQDMRLIAYPAAKKDKAYTVPDGVKAIGGSAFLWCGNPEKLTLPDSVETIAPYALSHMDKLKELNFGSGLKTVENHGFYSLSALEKITMPATVAVIGTDVADNCPQMGTLYVPHLCPAALWGTGMGFKVVYTDPAAYTILSPEKSDHLDLKYGEDVRIEWMVCPGAADYKVELIFTLPGTGVRVAYPTLYTDGQPDASGICHEEISLPPIFHALHEALGGPYAYSEWQAVVKIEARRPEP